MLRVKKGLFFRRYFFFSELAEKKPFFASVPVSIFSCSWLAVLSFFSCPARGPCRLPLSLPGVCRAFARRLLCCQSACRFRRLWFRCLRLCQSLRFRRLCSCSCLLQLFGRSMRRSRVSCSLRFTSAPGGCSGAGPMGRFGCAISFRPLLPAGAGFGLSVSVGLRSGAGSLALFLRSSICRGWLSRCVSVLWSGMCSVGFRKNPLPPPPPPERVGVGKDALKIGTIPVFF